MIRRSSLVLCAALVATVLVSGCGGSDATTTSSKAPAAAPPAATAGGQASATVPAKVRDEYLNLGRAVYQIGDNYGRATQAASGWSDAVAAKYFRGLADTAHKVARELKNATPTDSASIKKNQAATVSGLKRLATDLDALAAAGKAKDKVAAQEAAAKITTDAAEMNSPLNAMIAAVQQ